MVTPQDGAKPRSETQSSAQDERDRQERERWEELMRIYEKLKDTQLFAPEQAELQARLEVLGRQFEQTGLQARLEEIQRRYQEMLSRYQELKAGTPEHAQLRAQLTGVLQEVTGLQARMAALREMSEEQRRQLELNLTQGMRQQMDPERLRQIQESLQEYARKHQMNRYFQEQDWAESVRKALEAQAGALEKYNAGLITDASLSEVSKVLAEHLAALQKDRDFQTSQLTAEWAARKAELEQALKQLSDSNPDTLLLMQQRAEIERLTAAYGQLMLRKVQLEAQIKKLLPEHGNDSAWVKRLQTELESVKRELEKLVK